jgi:hypothetical protein
MATLALSVAGQFVGGLLGGPIGATVGRALGALAGSAVDSAIFGPKPAATSPPTGDITLQGSSEGGAIPRLYGWTRLTGNIIWATQLDETTQQTAGGKGTQTQTTTTYRANFALGLCEGEVARLGRVWADGDLLDLEKLNYRFYPGSETQEPDSLIAGKQGNGNAPAYRGLCYLVFEGLSLTPFGNRIPNLTVELCRLAGDLEPMISAVTVIPGATEFGYDPKPRVRLLSAGSTGHENAHVYPDISDWTVSLDELQALCPKLTNVSLVVAWFGDDLRCAHCSIAPRVEANTRDIEGAAWSVSGLTRGTARLVSSADGAPAYGATPSDASVLAAIADLKARGLAVTLYPMVMMDIPAGNALADPLTGAASQPAYPWRGRITCDPAPGVTGSPDTTSAAATQVATFLGAATAADFFAFGSTVTYAGATDWGYRRMALHYAELAKLAGGIDALVFGSELRGLTTIRGAADSFLFVDGLATLAADLRAVLGAATKLVYAADWSEFTGYQPPGAPSDKYFHLDALWASAAVDALGLDNYMPVADWRDGTDNIDAGTADSIYDPAYLQANIAGGEGFDWYYASQADRLANIRTPITDGAYGEPWIWRFKDLVSWWSNAHHNRVGGVRAATATGWVPESKPIWFTELGCAAVDKGPNQPNIFPDPKSAENGRPYFSTGASDALVQRQFLRAHLGWWRPDGPDFADAQNPSSTGYAGRMVDPDRIYLWTWDARPFPAFPNEVDDWADGNNYYAGHWLTGRLGALASDELVAAVAADFGITVGAADAAPPLLFGLELDSLGSARDALQSALDSTGLSVHDTAAGLAFARPKPRLALTIDAETIVAADGPLASRKRPDSGEIVGRVALSYIDRQRDYLNGSVTAVSLAGGSTSGSDTSLVLDLAGARGAAERLLASDASSRETLDLTLPPSLAALEPNDVVAIAGEGNGPFVVTALTDGAARQAALQALPPDVTAAILTDRPLPTGATAGPRAIPVVDAAHLPNDPASPGPSRLLFAASSSPWPGSVEVNDADAGTTLATLGGRGSLGVVAAPLAPGPVAVWDDATALTLVLYWGHLASADDLAVLAGANRIAVESDSGEWEIIGFANATLTAPSTYVLTHLLRGQGGTVHAVGSAAAGAAVMVLDAGADAIPVPSDWLGQTLDLTAYAGSTDATGVAFSATVDLSPALPLAPVHLAATRDPVSGDIALSWLRCSRSDTNSWSTIDAPLDVSPEAYAVSIVNGGTVVRTLSASLPAATYSSADQTTDFGSLPASFDFAVAQLSPTLGAGLAAEGSFHG